MKKLTLKLSLFDICEIISLIGYRIEYINRHARDHGKLERTEDEFDQEAFYINDLLSLLDQLLKSNPLNTEDGYTLGNATLFQQLGQVKRKCDFPPSVQKFYDEYSEYEIESYRKSFICDVCGQRGATTFSSDMIIHKSCPRELGWYRCSLCHWLYPFNSEYCKNSECKKRKLAKCA